MKSFKLICLLISFFTFYLQLYPLYSQELEDNNCLYCHTNNTSTIQEKPPHLIDKEVLESSVHQDLDCIYCHSDIKEVPHKEELKKVDCSQCHYDTSEEFAKSIHGESGKKNIQDLPACTDCHGKHDIYAKTDTRSLVYHININETCIKCHGDPKIIERHPLPSPGFVKRYRESVHGRCPDISREPECATCSDCHGSHDVYAASDPRSKIFHGNVPNTCKKCHKDISEVYYRSVHGKATKSGIKEAAVCTDCHGEHTIQALTDPKSSVYKGAISKTCSACHDSEKVVMKFGLSTDRAKSFYDSYHGLAFRGGDLSVANCASCHGWHDILPASAPQSSIHPKNLPQTCGKCHPATKTGLIIGKIHVMEKAEEHFLLRFFRDFYLVLIPLVIGAMMINNLADYFRKLITSTSLTHSPTQREYRILRMNLNERIQHGILLSTFIVLAYSGFALKYPDTWWVIPFNLLGGESMRKAVHRWSAFVFILNSIYHLCYMSFTRRGRFILIHNLFPKIKDMIDPFRLLAYNFFLTKKPDRIQYPSYIEKIEYWALIWGSLIMIVTGGLLFFNDYTLRYFSLWLANLSTMIHFYEAILASLAILVWHFYWVIFDPDVYPMNRSWITGKMVKPTTQHKGG